MSADRCIENERLAKEDRSDAEGVGFEICAGLLEEQLLGQGHIDGDVTASLSAMISEIAPDDLYEYLLPLLKAHSLGDVLEAAENFKAFIRSSTTAYANELARISTVDSEKVLGEVFDSLNEQIDREFG